MVYLPDPVDKFEWLTALKDLKFVGNHFQHNYSDEILEFIEKLPKEVLYLLANL